MQRLVQRIVTLTCGKPPGEATHWTRRPMAKEAGVSLRTVQRIWQMDAPINLAESDVICFNFDVAEGNEACRINRACPTSMTGCAG